MSRPLNRESLSAYRQGIDALSLESEPLWGSLDAHRLLPHLRILLEIALGEREEEDVSNFLLRSRLTFWMMMWMPWPKGKVKAPDYLTPEPEEDFEEERRKLLAVMERFADEVESNPRQRTKSPILGWLALADWSRLQGKHLTHHLEQFGIPTRK